MQKSAAFGMLKDLSMLFHMGDSIVVTRTGWGADPLMSGKKVLIMVYVNILRRRYDQ